MFEGWGLIGTGTAVVNETYDVFISYSRLDSRDAAELDSKLRANGLKSFFDRRNLSPGLPWVRALEQAIGAAKAVVVLIGRGGLGNTQQYERELAFVRQSRDPTFPVVPVILPGASTDLPFNFLQVLTWIDFSHVTKVSDAPLELQHLLTAVRGEPVSGEVVHEAICPYRGLDAFREEDSAFFFGRGSVDDAKSPIGELVRKVREQPFVMVVGRSGSGKSSLVYAGLLPALRRERDPFWNVLTLRPGPTPLRALAAAFNPRADNEGAADYATKITDEADKLRTGDTELLSHMIRQELDQAEGKPDRLLLYIDQWEELYAQAPSSSDKERAAQHTADVNRFIDLLLNAAQTAPVSVVGTVRADFYDPLIGHAQIRALLPTRQVLLAAMSRSELESTIVEPAKKVGLTFDPPSLVKRILDEAGEDEGMLPLLQYALKESWALRKDNTITADSYARSGGVREAIRVTAERTFAALSVEDQQAARQLFLRLVTPGEGQEDTRARAAMPSEPTQRRIVEQFAGPRTRLLVTGSDRAQRPIVEVAHEALIRTWPRLRGWIDANREKLRARTAVLQAKAEWEQQGRREDLLLPAGFQLERARALLADPGDLAIADIQEFIALSSAREERERKDREDALARDEAQVAEIKAAQDRTAAAQVRTAQLQRITRWAFAAVGALILIAAATVGYSLWDKAQRLAREQIQNFSLVGLSAQTLLDQINALLDSGGISVQGANAMLQTAGKIVSSVEQVQGRQTIGLTTKLLLTTSDIRATMGDFQGAFVVANESKELTEQLLKGEPNDQFLLQIVFDSSWRIADALDEGATSSTPEEAFAEYDYALEIARQLASLQPRNRARQREVTFILQKIGDARMARIDLVRAFNAYENALEITNELVSADPNDVNARRDLAAGWSRLGNVSRNQKQFDRAQTEYFAAIQIRSTLALEDPNNDLTQAGLARAYFDVGNLHALGGQLADAMAEFQKGLEIRQRLTEKDPDNFSFRIALAYAYQNIGDVLKLQGNISDALEQYKESLEIQRKLLFRDPTNSTRQKSFVKIGTLVVQLTNTLAAVFETQGQRSEAVDQYRTAIGVLEELQKLDGFSHGDKVQYGRDEFVDHAKIGDILIASNESKGALKEYDLALRTARKYAENDSRDVEWTENLASAHIKAADIMTLQDDFSGALDHYRNAQTILEKLSSSDPSRGSWVDMLQATKAKINKLVKQ